ncbi:MAG: ABC transporter substrate-binding protein [Chloroflexus sp.]|nr:ABC transporter substrate-binding protein [Chloroflexus sp.]
MNPSDERLHVLQMARSEVLAGRMSRRAFLRLGLALGLSAGATALVACGSATPSPEPTAAPAPTQSGPTGRLRVASEIPVQLDPAFASSDAEILILNHVYDYLVDIDAGNNVIPRLAREWTMSDDGLRYRLTLADGVYFHDGSPLTAADVVWTFNRLRDRSLQLPTADLYANIADITADGENAVVFTLTAPNPFFLYDLSDNHALVLRAGVTNPATAFNGTGPFKVVEYRTENRIDLAAHQAYFQAGKPAIANLEIIFFADQAAAVDALRGRQVDLVLRMPTPLFQTLQQTAGIVAVQTPTNGFDLVRLRADRAPGNQPDVIRALKLATDRQAIFRQVKAGLGAVGRDSPIGPLFSAYYSEETPIPPRDPAAARALLAAAGYPNGLKLDLHVPDSGDRPDLAVVLKEQWAEAGIDINVIVEPESVYYGDNGWLEVDLGITGWGSRPVPQFYLDVMLVSGAVWNESHFSDAEFDALAATARTTLDEAERVRAYREIQRILIERGPIIIPYFFAQLSAHREGLRGYVAKAFPGRTDLAVIAV